MLGPQVVASGSSSLEALIEVLAKPEETKKQIAEMRKLLEDTEKVRQGAIAEQAKVAKAQEELTAREQGARKTLEELKKAELALADARKQRDLTVEDARVRSQELENKAKALHDKVVKENQEIAAEVQSRVKAEEAKLLQVKSEADRQQRRLDDINARLQELGAQLRVA